MDDFLFIDVGYPGSAIYTIIASPHTIVKVNKHTHSHSTSANPVTASVQTFPSTVLYV